MRAFAAWLVTALAVAAAVWLIPGIEIVSANVTLSIAVLAIVLAFLNAFIKPVLQIISLPVTILTLGIFGLIVNTLVLELAAWFANGLFDVGLVINSFWSALLASIIISIVAVILNGLLGTKDKGKENN